MTLGRVIAGRPILPVVSTDARPWTAELRAGTVVGGWELTTGAGAEEAPQGDGRLWTVTAPSTTTFSGGDLTESREGSYLGFPAVRLLAHTWVDGRVPERIRAVLNFYRTALPDYPYDEVVVLQEPDRPVLTVSSTTMLTGLGGHSRLETREDVRDIVPTLRSLGGGQLAIQGLVEVPIGGTPLGQLETAVDSQWPHALERALAEAVAAGWWESLPWSDHDRWLARALPAVYRDRFVEEAWNEEVVRRWEVFADERIAEGAPRGELAPLVGTDAAWSGEVGARLLTAVGERIGEEALLPVEHDAGGDELGPVAKVMVAFAFAPARPGPLATAPPPGATVERGAYLAHRVAYCVFCHTEHDPLTMADTAPPFSGGTPNPSMRTPRWSSRPRTSRRTRPAPSRRSTRTRSWRGSVPASSSRARRCRGRRSAS